MNQLSLCVLGFFSCHSDVYPSQRCHDAKNRVAEDRGQVRLEINSFQL